MIGQTKSNKSRNTRWAISTDESSSIQITTATTFQLNFLSTILFHFENNQPISTILTFACGTQMWCVTWMYNMHSYSIASRQKKKISFLVCHYSHFIPYSTNKVATIALHCIELRCTLPDARSYFVCAHNFICVRMITNEKLSQ